MELETTRFGTIRIEADDIITFEDGAGGLSRIVVFVLIRHDNEGPFWVVAVG
jgi:hypothetical protein